MNYLVRGGYTFQPNSRYQVTPFVALNYNDTKWNGYQETGDGAFLATFSNQRSHVSTLHIDVDNQYQIDDKNSMGMTLGLRKTSIPITAQVMLPWWMALVQVWDQLPD
ncbi:MAG: autotransporter outer membrane beta-barrel domain-containing protein [Plesiomonas shigelloides]